MKVFQRMCDDEEVSLDISLYCMLLRLCVTMPWTKKKPARAVSREYATAIMDHWSARKPGECKADETFFSLMIKAVCSWGDCARARALLSEMKVQDNKGTNKGWILKRRTYSPMLAAAGADVALMLDVYADSQVEDVEMREAEFRAMIVTCGLAKDGEALSLILHDMKEYVYSISPATAEALKGAFAAVTAAEVAAEADPATGAAAAAAAAAAAEDSTQYMNATNINETGMCSSSGVELVARDLSEEEREAMLLQIEQVARGGEKSVKAAHANKKPKMAKADEKERSPDRSPFNEFKKWLDKRGGGVISGVSKEEEGEGEGEEGGGEVEVSGGGLQHDQKLVPQGRSFLSTSSSTAQTSGSTPGARTSAAAFATRRSTP